MGNRCSSHLYHMNRIQLQTTDLISNVVSKQYEPVGMSKILDHLYLGNYDDSINIQKLRDEGITHVINTVEHNCKKTGTELYGNEFQYLGFTSKDEERYPIMKHFDVTYNFIERARESGGKCLIHCMAGMNRSGALAVAYVMVHKNIGPVTATRIVYNARKTLLSNEGFIRRLVKLSYEKKLLVKDMDEILSSED